MGNPILNENDLKNIIFDVLDGVEASENETKEAYNFRQEIEGDERNMTFRGEELGLRNLLVEFSMDN